jgi:hypothetical protein
MEERQLPSAYDRERKLLADARVKSAFHVVATVKQHHRRFFQLWARNDVEVPDNDLGVAN